MRRFGKVIWMNHVLLKLMKLAFKVGRFVSESCTILVGYWVWYEITLYV